MFVRILDACGFFPKIGISVLIQRCLLKVSGRNTFTMHDLLRDMGREIVREKHPNEPGKWSRLWRHEDAFDILTKHEVIRTFSIEIIERKTEHFIF
jgi:hypothetical protein